MRDNVSAIGIVGGSGTHSLETGQADIRIIKCIKDNTGPGNQTACPSFEVYAVTHEPFTGLGSGFISFLVGQKGQLILSKSGMIPYKPIEREVRISDSI